jgi:hypothetical protein
MNEAPVRRSARLRTPVPRQGAERYLLETLLAFAVSVGLTRAFLSLTGYPQIGGGGLHIAHVLWGGLLLFAAALLPLLWANRWVYDGTALLAGLGVGLFIDEVGKFITESNDYFFPAAAPIVYAFFLLTVMLYQRARKPRRRAVRDQLYHALDGFQEWLDHDLDRREHAALRNELTGIASQSEDPDGARLAGDLLAFLERQAGVAQPVSHSHWQRWRLAGRRRLGIWLSEPRMRLFLAVVLVGLGLLSLKNPASIALQSANPTLSGWLAGLAYGRHVDAVPSSSLMMARAALEVTAGAMLLLGGLLIFARRARPGVAVAYGALLLLLTTVDLLVFYFEQFSTMLTAGVQLLALLGVLYYRNEFMEPVAEIPRVAES